MPQQRPAGAAAGQQRPAAATAGGERTPRSAGRPAPGGAAQRLRERPVERRIVPSRSTARRRRRRSRTGRSSRPRRAANVAAVRIRSAPRPLPPDRRRHRRSAPRSRPPPGRGPSSQISAAAGSAASGSSPGGGRGVKNSHTAATAPRTTDRHRERRPAAPRPPTPPGRPASWRRRRPRREWPPPIRQRPPDGAGAGEGPAGGGGRLRAAPPGSGPGPSGRQQPVQRRPLVRGRRRGRCQMFVSRGGPPSFAFPVGRPAGSAGRRGPSGQPVSSQVSSTPVSSDRLRRLGPFREVRDPLQRGGEPREPRLARRPDRGGAGGGERRGRRGRSWRRDCRRRVREEQPTALARDSPDRFRARPVGASGIQPADSYRVRPRLCLHRRSSGCRADRGTAAADRPAGPARRARGTPTPPSRPTRRLAGPAGLRRSRRTLRANFASQYVPCDSPACYGRGGRPAPGRPAAGAGARSSRARTALSDGRERRGPASPAGPGGAVGTGSPVDGPVSARRPPARCSSLRTARMTALRTAGATGSATGATGGGTRNEPDSGAHAASDDPAVRDDPPDRPPTPGPRAAAGRAAASGRRDRSASAGPMPRPRDGADRASHRRRRLRLGTRRWRTRRRWTHRLRTESARAPALAAWDARNGLTAGGALLVRRTGPGPAGDGSRGDGQADGPRLRARAAVAVHRSVRGHRRVPAGVRGDGRASACSPRRSTPSPADAYEANFGERPRGDLTQIDAADVPEHDVLLGGFPCQPFSIIGQAAGVRGHPRHAVLRRRPFARTSPPGRGGAGERQTVPHPRRRSHLRHGGPHAGGPGLYGRTSRC